MGFLFKKGKYLSLILRHKPELINLKLDSKGYGSTRHICSYLDMTMTDLIEIVETNDKRRFKFNYDKTMVKANQGHSIKIDLELTPVTPPQYLYHGTVMRNFDSMVCRGINKMKRHHVHLTENIGTAKKVGKRYGEPVVLIIEAFEMSKNGYTFFCTDNNVWLVNDVPFEYFSIL